MDLRRKADTLTSVRVSAREARPFWILGLDFGLRNPVATAPRLSIWIADLEDGKHACRRAVLPVRLRFKSIFHTHSRYDVRSEHDVAVRQNRRAAE